MAGGGARPLGSDRVRDLQAACGILHAGTKCGGNSSSAGRAGGKARSGGAHPVWPVREAAATVLSSLVELDIRRFGIIASLFEDPNWRVCYGAIEAAFAVRHFDKMTMFSRAVHRFHAHPNCRIRGLCAENLVSIIVNVGGSMRHGLLADFSQEISYWLRDDDCWVLEHIFRLISNLRRRNIEIAQLLSSGVAPLLENTPGWFELDRETFVLQIEHRKIELQQSRRIG